MFMRCLAQDPGRAEAVLRGARWNPLPRSRLLAAPVSPADPRRPALPGPCSRAATAGAASRAAGCGRGLGARPVRARQSLSVVLGHLHVALLLVEVGRRGPSALGALRAQPGAGLRGGLEKRLVCVGPCEGAVYPARSCFVPQPACLHCFHRTSMAARFAALLPVGRAGCGAAVLPGGLLLAVEPSGVTRCRNAGGLSGTAPLSFAECCSVPGALSFKRQIVIGVRMEL